MALDPNRASLVMQEYRYTNSTVEDASIAAKFDNASEMLLDTNLDEGAATSLSNYLFNLTKTPAKVFSMTVEGVLYPEDFTVSPPRYTLALQRHPAAGTDTYTLGSATVDWGAGTIDYSVRS